VEYDIDTRFIYRGIYIYIYFWRKKWICHPQKDATGNQTPSNFMRSCFSTFLKVTTIIYNRIIYVYIIYISNPHGVNEKPWVSQFFRGRNPTRCSNVGPRLGKEPRRDVDGMRFLRWTYGNGWFMNQDMIWGIPKSPQVSMLEWSNLDDTSKIWGFLSHGGLS